MKSFVKIIGLSIVLIVFQALLPSPWWLFVLPTFLFGVIAPRSFWKKNVFFKGFLAGAISWSFPMIYFGMTLEGDITSVLSGLVTLPYPLIVVVVGIFGGVLVGLALMSGAQLRAGKEEIKLEL